MAADASVLKKGRSMRDTWRIISQYYQGPWHKPTIMEFHCAYS